MFTTLAAHLVGPIGGFGWAFLLFPLFWILVVVLIFGVFGRRWRRNAWTNGYGYGHHPYWGGSARSAESSLAEVPDTAQLDVLTEREREVLALVGLGLTNDEIGKRLFLSPLTAKTHVSRIMSKLLARDRVQLVVIAYETGLVAPGRQ